MPAHNEAAIIELTVREWYREVVSRIPQAELLVVDDCSTDETGRILERLAAELPALRPLRTPCNGGHGRALRFGFRHVRRPFVFQTDSDRQHLPEEFWKLWNRRDDCDFVFGTRAERADGATRYLITLLMKCLNLALWQVWLADANCPFKLMRAEPLQEILRRLPETFFIPMVMVSILSRKMKFRVEEVAVTHLPRSGGTQSLKGLWKWARVGSLCVGQLVRLRLSRHREPERVVSAQQ